MSNSPSRPPVEFRSITKKIHNRRTSQTYLEISVTTSKYELSDTLVRDSYTSGVRTSVQSELVDGLTLRLIIARTILFIVST